METLALILKTLHAEKFMTFAKNAKDVNSVENSSLKITFYIQFLVKKNMYFINI